MSETTILLFELNSDEFLKSKVFKLEKGLFYIKFFIKIIGLFLGWILRFILGKGLYGKKVKLIIKPKNREFIFEEAKNLEDFDLHVDFVCDTFGSFRSVLFIFDILILFVLDMNFFWLMI